MVKRILCFGNSNTWAYVPGTGERLDYNSRWIGIVARLLAKKYKAISPKNQVSFLDITATVKSSLVDVNGVHLNKENHQKLA